MQIVIPERIVALGGEWLLDAGGSDAWHLCHVGATLCGLPLSDEHGQRRNALGHVIEEACPRCVQLALQLTGAP